MSTKNMLNHILFNSPAKNNNHVGYAANKGVPVIANTGKVVKIYQNFITKFSNISSNFNINK